MMKKDYIEYIQHHVYTLANSQYRDPQLATQYAIGFLTAQLAEAMWADSDVTYRFKRSVNQKGVK